MIPWLVCMLEDDDAELRCLALRVSVTNLGPDSDPRALTRNPHPNLTLITVHWGM